MDKSSTKSIFVVGDVMLDSYFDGRVTRISPEAPIPIVNHSETTYKLGGAANVAHNLAKSDVTVRLFGIVGEDVDGKILSSLVEKSGIESGLLVSANKRTINKLRICSQGQQIVRVDFEDYFIDIEAKALNSQVVEGLNHCSLLILSDYAKGTLHDINFLISEAKLRGVPVLVDPKGVDFDKYRDASILTPNKSEFELVVGQCLTDADLVFKGAELRGKLNLGALLVTLSEKGMMLFEKGRTPLHIPAISRDVVDVTGAGDTAIAWLARGLIAGLSVTQAVIRSNVASSLAVSKLGTHGVTLSEVIALESEINEVPMPEELSDYVSECRAKGQTIVFTNGCFDILHEGHVTYLEEAKRYGDKLIVGINTDSSVKRLKGHLRPINSLNSRVKVLKALSSVDFVVSFSQDTPIELIKEITPDVLVKGGDYIPKEIVGGDYVEKNGGKVLTIGFVEGFSTSKLIEAASMLGSK
jgi:D-beta-D-heptose 7-phosphate kinase/D-beta-D-heptose 1-phosphate adenosyltransferase